MLTCSDLKRSNSGSSVFQMAWPFNIKSRNDMATIYKSLWPKNWRETHSARTNKKLLNRWPWYWATEQLLFRAKKIDFAFPYSTFLRVCTDGTTNWQSNESNRHLHVNNNNNRRVSNGHSFWLSETVYLLINISPHSFINLTVSDALYFVDEQTVYEG